MATSSSDCSHDVKQPDLGLVPTTSTVSQDDLISPEICVICLDRISEKATALPCEHEHFDFPCLGTWLQQQRSCPLCKSLIKAIKYQDNGVKSDSTIFYLPTPDLPKRPSHDIQRRRSRAQQYITYNQHHSLRNAERGTILERSNEDKALDTRRQVYRNRTPSLYVGVNRISGYRNITPTVFQDDPSLISRAKVFIRRELSVFDFLQPSSPSFGSYDRRATNAEFLLEYVVSILKSIDLKGSTGQAEELLRDFLGRDNARLFLHELEAWLRSPCERLEDWDRRVQYSRRR